VGAGISADVAVVIAAAGSSARMGGGVRVGGGRTGGVRMGGNLKKEYRFSSSAYGSGEPAEDIDGTPLTVLGMAVKAFLECARIGRIVISVPPSGDTGEAAARAALPRRFFDPPFESRILFASGGASRRASVHGALALLAPDAPAQVLIHDGARPWVDRELIDRTIDAVLVHGAVVPVQPLVETPKEIDREGKIVRHLRRSSVVAAQTPQGFSFPDILRAHEKAEEKERQEGIEFTDDAEVWAAFVGIVFTVPGSPGNKKITFPEDL
jgi:2-C-methyl-D-erythritol 4-phosphate cytidylyltransferase/2-C-methyl-D-erythritol 4-phosphate cytidylyltransferase/2-C-methyl-D-erythritol 2,4-cyclodiphosphate synthase